MYGLLKRLIRFKIGQKMYRGAARGVGLHGLAKWAGVVGGIHYMRKHS